MKLLTEELEDLVSDIDNENPDSYDYGWRLNLGSVTTSKALKLNLLPEEISEGWWLYNFKVNYHLVHEVNQK